MRIRRDVLAAVVAHARRDAPNECCGFLVGSPDSVDVAVPARNVLAHQSRYSIDPAEHIALNRALRETPDAIVGVYHSHPLTPAVPSPRDLAEAHYPEFLWLIVSLQDEQPDCRAYRIVDATALPVQLSVIP